MNDIIRRTLITAGILVVIEWSGLVRDDDKRPDGLSSLPRKMGNSLVWDATCIDILAPPLLPSTAGSAGAGATFAESFR